MKEELLNRFVDYAKTFSTSSSKNADAGIQPSTECQRDFAQKIAAELKELGFCGVQVTEHAYVYAYIPASPKNNNAPAEFCLLSHLDTVEEVCGKNVNPQIEESGGDTIIRTDGNTLLGGDDKAGLSAIVTALHYLLAHPETRHPKIELCFSPDEETGHGMDNVPLNLIESKYAYTVDGGHIGELECECFNAFKSQVIFTGIAAHTGEARKAGMVNAISAAAAFVQSLPRHEAPETTDGRQGFFAPFAIKGDMERAEVSLLLRDFDSDGMERRKSLVEQLASAQGAAFGAGVQVVHTEQYRNMRAGIEKMPAVRERLVAAYRAAGVEPVFKLIRGGTDGARLTETGIPCPNIFTGAHDYHSTREWVSLEQMHKAACVIVELAKSLA